MEKVAQTCVIATTSRNHPAWRVQHHTPALITTLSSIWCFSLGGRTLPTNCCVFMASPQQDTQNLHLQENKSHQFLYTPKDVIKYSRTRFMCPLTDAAKGAVPWARERFLRLRLCPPANLVPVKMAFTLWAQICWLPSSDTPHRGSDICLTVALSSSPVTGSRDSHWNSLQREREEMSEWRSSWRCRHLAFQSCQESVIQQELTTDPTASVRVSTLLLLFAAS